MEVLLKESLPNNFPTDLIKLLSSFICDCADMKCDYCDNFYSNCYLKRCACCKRKSCGNNECPNYQVDFIMSYSMTHKMIKCCHKCLECKSDD